MILNRFCFASLVSVTLAIVLAGIVTVNTNAQAPGITSKPLLRTTLIVYFFSSGLEVILNPLPLWRALELWATWRPSLDDRPAELNSDLSAPTGKPRIRLH